MNNTFNIGSLRVTLFPYDGNNRVCYIPYPVDSLSSWLAVAPAHFQTSIVVISGIDWDNDLTPWPAPGQPPGSPDFQGLAGQFLTDITERIIPRSEKMLGIENADRNIVGVSLAGLFALWQWVQCSVFRSIGILSGSFWYDGFVQWLQKQKVPVKTGCARFLLGRDEPHSPVKAFDTVGVNTALVVDFLKKSGIDTSFQWVPGNHFADPIGRLNIIFGALNDFLKSV